MTTYRLYATFETILWSDDPEDEDYSETRGYVEPSNPWGSIEWTDGAELCGPAFTAWKDEFAPYEGFATIDEVIEFAAQFPGGIWDISESESEQNYRTGEWKSVMLHIPDEIVNQVAEGLANSG